MRISILLEPAMPSRFFNAEIKKLFLPFPQIELVFQDVADILRNGVRGEVFLNSHGEIYPYVIEDVSEKAKAFSETVNDNIWRLGKIKFQKEEVMQEPGSQCKEPYECWYYDYCHRPKE